MNCCGKALLLATLVWLLAMAGCKEKEGTPTGESKPTVAAPPAAKENVVAESGPSPAEMNNELHGANGRIPVEVPSTPEDRKMLGTEYEIQKQIMKTMRFQQCKYEKEHVDLMEQYVGAISSYLKGAPQSKYRDFYQKRYMDEGVKYAYQLWGKEEASKWAQQHFQYTAIHRQAGDEGLLKGLNVQLDRLDMQKERSGWSIPLRAKNEPK